MFFKSQSSIMISLASPSPFVFFLLLLLLLLKIVVTTTDLATWYSIYFCNVLICRLQIARDLNYYLEQYSHILVKQTKKRVDWSADPRNTNNTWGPWVKLEDTLCNAAAALGNLAYCIHISAILVSILLSNFIWPCNVCSSSDSISKYCRSIKWLSKIENQLTQLEMAHRVLNNRVIICQTEQFWKSQAEHTYLWSFYH